MDAWDKFYLRLARAGLAGAWLCLLAAGLLWWGVL